MQVGERVLKGQLIAAQEGSLGAPVHASSSGTVVGIEAWPIVRRLGDRAPCIVIETDGEDRALDPAPRPPYTETAPQELAQRILDGGIVGLGGAAFPTAQKLIQANTCKLDHLLLNGVECEPYISCDDVLMRERADAVVDGSRILMHVLGLSSCYIVVESDKPEALRALAAALTDARDERIVLKQVPTIYPSGGERPARAARDQPRGTERRIAVGHRLPRAERRHRGRDSRLDRTRRTSDLARHDHHRRRRARRP